MKKVLLLFALLVGALSAMATEVITYDFTAEANEHNWPRDATTTEATYTSAINPELTITFCNSFWQKSKANSHIAEQKNDNAYVKIAPIKDKIVTAVNLYLPNNVTPKSAFELLIGETSLGKFTWSSAGSNSTEIQIPANLQSADNTLIIKTANTKNQCGFGKLILTVEDAVKVEADHAAITPESKEFTNNIDVTLKAFDAQNAEVNGANIYYTLNGGAQQTCKSPYSINLTETTTVEAWVEGQESHATATFTLNIPEVQPGNPVFSANGTTLTGDEVTLPYGTELNITAENAVSLEVLAGEDIQEIQGNSYTITITDDVDIMVTAHNGSLSSEGMISVKLADPTLTVKAGEQVIENNGTYTFDKGTIITIAADNAHSVSVIDSENIVIDLVNNSFEPTKDDIYTVKATAGSKVTEITFSVELTIPEYQNVTATFDFVNNAYGLGEHSSSVETGTYEPADKDIAEKDVNLLLTGKFRRWNKGDAYDFRTYDASSITVKVPVNCYITNITFSGKSIGNISYGNSKVNNVFFTSADKVKEVIFKTTSNQINTITVNYVKDNYTATATVEVDEENPYEYAYGHANVLVFKPQILFNGNPIEDTEYANYEVRLNGAVLGQADQAELLNYFDYDKKNVFTLHKGEKTINVEVKWPEIDVNPVISEVEYLKEDDGKMHAIYYVMPENNPQGFNWSVVCDNADMLYWNGKTGAACQFNEVGDQAENAPEALKAHIKYPFAVRKVSSASQTIKLMAENDDIEIREYHAPDTSLSTADVAKPNENNTSGVADVAVDQDSEVEFFNLQGVRVEGELTPGLYIRRQGNQATKIVVK